MCATALVWVASCGSQSVSRWAHLVVTKHMPQILWRSVTQCVHVSVAIDRQTDRQAGGRTVTHRPCKLLFSAKISSRIVDIICHTSALLLLVGLRSGQGLVCLRTETCGITGGVRELYDCFELLNQWNTAFVEVPVLVQNLPHFASGVTATLQRAFIKIQLNVLFRQYIPVMYCIVLYYIIILYYIILYYIPYHIITYYIFKNASLRIAFWSCDTIYIMLRSRKQIQNQHLKSGMYEYKLKSHGCDNLYVGQSGRNKKWDFMSIYDSLKQIISSQHMHKRNFVINMQAYMAPWITPWI
jgi:hypothetical protein